MNWWQRFKKSSAHIQASIVMSAVITFATVAYSIIAAVQLHVMRQASEDSSTQAKKLIDAANRVGDAANSFSQSAQGINIGVANAVEDLRKQVDQISRSVDTAHQAIEVSKEQARIEERPWVSFVSVLPADLPDGSERIALQIRNGGKTPAFDAHSAFLVEWHRDASVSIPEIHQVLDERQAKGRSTIGPGEPSLIPGNDQFPPDFVRNYKLGKLRLYLRGAIWYSDYWATAIPSSFVSSTTPEVMNGWHANQTIVKISPIMCVNRFITNIFCLE